MPHHFAAIAFTPTVKAVQEAEGSRAANALFESATEAVNQCLGAAEAEFITARDSFYLATVSETGWPYLQHRGGPPGFVRVLDDRTIGFADFRGNRQYVSVGNLKTNDRMALFFMDYRHRTRLKLLGRARVVDLDDHTILSKLEMPDYRARVERGLLITVEGFDWNCKQHITERFTREEVRTMIAPMVARITELEALLAQRQ